MASGTRRPSGQLASRLAVTSSRICLGALATRLPPLYRRRGSLSLPRPPIGDSGQTRYGNINPLAIDYAFRPRLRSRLTLSRRTLLRKPWTIGGGDSHPSFVTHADILTPQASTADLRRRFTRAGNALLPRTRSRRNAYTRSFGDWLEPRYIFRARTLDQ